MFDIAHDAEYLERLEVDAKDVLSVSAARNEDASVHAKARAPRGGRAMAGSG